MKDFLFWNLISDVYLSEYLVNSKSLNHSKSVKYQINVVPITLISKHLIFAPIIKLIPVIKVNINLPNTNDKKTTLVFFII